MSVLRNLFSAVKYWHNRFFYLHSKAMVKVLIWPLPHAKKSLLILSAMVEEFLWLLPHATIRLQAVGR